MKKNIAIKLDNVSKQYKIYDKARDRVKEAFNPFRKKYYKNFCAIDNISLEIEKGEVLGLFGLNGAGKSTLLKMIAGVLTPSSGRINVNGHINAMIEIGGSLNPELTGRQNIKFNLDLNNIPDNQRDRITQEIIDFAEIGLYIDQPVKNYSSGMGARLGFGIATATKPEILIVDEVLAVGDAIFQSKCFTKIRSLLKGGTTVVFVSHNIPLMIEFCSRAVFIYDKKIVFDGPVKKIAEYYERVLFSGNKKKTIENIQNQRGDEFDSTLMDNSSRLLESENESLEILRLSLRGDSRANEYFLQAGKDYTLMFEVGFKKDFHKIRLVFNLEDVTGKELDFLSLYKENDLIENVIAGSKYSIKNIFTWKVFTGIYYISFAVKFINEDGLEVMLAQSKKYMLNSVGVKETNSSLTIRKLEE